jgi:hypothetical protein
MPKRRLNQLNERRPVLQKHFSLERSGCTKGGKLNKGEEGGAMLNRRQKTENFTEGNEENEGGGQGNYKL